MTLFSKRANTDQLKNCYNHSASIKFIQFDLSSEMPLLIGADSST